MCGKLRSHILSTNPCIANQVCSMVANKALGMAAQVRYMHHTVLHASVTSVGDIIIMVLVCKPTDELSNRCMNIHVYTLPQGALMLLRVHLPLTTRS